jgi:hypothetical protein
VSSSASFSISAIWSCSRPFGHVKYIANRTTALATNSHEIIIPANIFQARAFVIAGTVSTRSASSILLGSAVWPVERSTGAFDMWNDLTGPVRIVEDKSATSPLPFAPICAGRALRFLGRGSRLFFMDSPNGGSLQEITTTESPQRPRDARTLFFCGNLFFADLDWLDDLLHGSSYFSLSWRDLLLGCGRLRQAG